MDALLQSVESRSYVNFVGELDAELQQSNFKVVLKELSTAMFSSQVGEQVLR